MDGYIYTVTKLVWTDSKRVRTMDSYRESSLTFDEEFSSMEEAKEAILYDAAWYESLWCDNAPFCKDPFYWINSTEYVWYNPDVSETKEGGIRYSIGRYWPK